MTLIFHPIYLQNIFKAALQSCSGVDPIGTVALSGSAGGYLLHRKDIAESRAGDICDDQIEYQGAENHRHSEPKVYGVCSM